LREEHKLHESENKMLRKIFRPKKKEARNSGFTKREAS
jgi:hypothetical protein